MGEQEDLISVIVPCYNIEHYVERCIRSIQNQTYKNIEIIAIDDGSKDKTGEILDKIAYEESRMIVFHYTNGGPSCARNHGLECMRGLFVLCVDGDDFLHSEALEKLYTVIVENDLDIAASNYTMYYGEYDQKIGNEADESNYNLTSEDFIKNLFTPSKRFCSAWGKLYKRELFDGIRYPEDIFFGEDMDVAPVLFDRAKKVGYTSETLYYYNQEGVSLVRSRFNINKLHMVDAARMWYELCEKKYPKLMDMAKENYLVTMINQCTLLADDKDYYSFYDTYRSEIKKERTYIENSSIGKKDKIKARLIRLFSPAVYRRVHRILKEVV